MPSSSARARTALALLALSSAVLPALACNGGAERPLLPRSQTWAELRTVRRAITVTPPGEAERAPYPRERVMDGEAIQVAPEGLAWLRRDGGATLLVRGPARLIVRADEVELAFGRVFIDTPAGVTAELGTPNGPLHLAHVRASIDVAAAPGQTSAYVLAGEVRTDGATRAGAGEQLVVTGNGAAATATARPALTWDDWTGGLATTDRAAEPSPYGVGTVGARQPGEQGSPRFPLAIQRLDVKVTVEQDFAITEVDEVFFNPSSEVVEGVYRFRTPDGATLHRFGVDRDGVVVWGRVKEKAAAAAQYQSNVYQGSTEDPALLEWDAPGVYRARLYPIGPGETRRVVVRYAEWLGRTGPKGERRLYVYPMAAEGAEESLPHIEELYATIDLGRAGAREIRAGMAGVREGQTLVVREHDLVPRADLAVELFDEGLGEARAYSAPHSVDVETLFPAERPEALKRAREEQDYLLVPVRPADAAAPTGGLDLAIIVDTSAATDPGSLAIARAATAALLAHVGKDDHVAVWGGDSGLRPVVPARAGLAPLDEAGRREVLRGLAAIERGGATDLGAMLTEAAAALDPARRGAIVYIGDGSPTVGELGLADLQARLAKLPRPVRIFGLGVGDGADMAILKGLSRGAFAERIGDANAAARAALRLLEVAERPAWLGAGVDLGPAVERIFPRELGALVADESVVVIGRLTGSSRPDTLTVTGPAGAKQQPLLVVPIEDHGDLRRRWAEGRLAQLIDESSGRAAMVDLGSRHGIITPVTSLYVPTRREMSPEELSELADARRSSSDRPRRDAYSYREDTAEKPKDDEEKKEKGNWGGDNKEGGTGTRAKGEEGSMGNPNSRSTGNRYGVMGPSDGASAPAQAVAAAVDAPMASAPSGSPPPVVVALPQAAPSAAAEAPAPMKVAGPMRHLAVNNPGPGAHSIVLEPPKPEPKAKATSETPDFIPQKVELDGKLANRDKWNGYMADESGAAPIGGAGGQGFGAGDGRLDQGLVAGNTKGAKNELSRNGELGWRSDGDLATRVTVRVGDVPHAAFRCGASAFVPLEERAQLWRERLGRVAGSAEGVANVYRRALASCEAPTFRERNRLLSMMLDVMPSAASRVALWRVMFTDLGASDTLYRGLVARVRTSAEARELHDALGLKAIDPDILEKLLKEAKTPGARVTKLRGLVAQWPDDFALALKLLDALEDAGDDGGARALGRALRARADADARVRSAVGELYLRFAARAATPALKAAEESEARRAFGEIVEFSPDDPVARRRLGDLLRAHGWYEDAGRQYETLARLAPDDPAASVLRAAAANGLGKLEEAVKWTEKGAAGGAPDQEAGPARAARAFALTYLSWGRLEAQKANRSDEATALGARLARLLSSERTPGAQEHATRATLTWEHPEIHPQLWTNALRAPMAVPEADATLGIVEARLPRRDGLFVEVKLDDKDAEHTARLGAGAVLTVVFDEGGEGEKIVKIPVVFAKGGPPTQRFSLDGGEVREVRP